MRQEANAYDTDIARRSFIWSPVGLFRFSALTFNAHMIHYSKPWCDDVEELPGLVIHGPLNLINMLDLWRDSFGKTGQILPRTISYQAKAPLFAGQSYSISIEESQQPGEYSVNVADTGKGGNMVATIIGHEV